MIVGRHVVPPAKITLINGLGVMVQRAVIIAHPEICFGKVRFADILRNFMHGRALVCLPHGLVMDVSIKTALVSE